MNLDVAAAMASAANDWQREHLTTQPRATRLTHQSR
jgi:hypothetical protein